MWPLFSVRTLLITGCFSVVSSDQTAFPESKSVDKKSFFEGHQEELRNYKTTFISLTLNNENVENYVYPRSNAKEKSAAEVSEETTAKKAYGEEGETWKVLGYSKETGYPIIDLSELGIDKSPKPYVPVPNKSKPKNDGSEIKKPMSYSEMKGAGLKKQASSASKNTNIKPNPLPVNESKMRERGKKVAHKLFMQLHRTNRYETVRSILYPDLNPPKYRITHNRDRFISLFRSESIGKYDIRYLDIEKLKDIVIPEAAVLVYKYFRDIPSLPLIYECKVKLAELTWSVQGTFIQLDRIFGNTYNWTRGQKRLDFVRWILRSLARALMQIKQSPPVTARAPAYQLENQINSLASELPFWSDKECYGKMDDKEWEQFNFEYKYMHENIQLGALNDAKKKKRFRDKLFS